MFVLESYSIGVLFCLITMLCWGSWGNAQKLAGKTWRYELFYWDYVFGVVITALIFALTWGSNGEHGRSFAADLSQANMSALGSAFLGGIVFNAGNILLVAAIAIAGLSVAFPIGIGLALALGVLLNFVAKPDDGNPLFLFGGVALVVVAIILNAIAYKKLASETAAKTESDQPEQEKKADNRTSRGIALAVCCGILMSLFYFFVARSIADVQLDGKAVSLTASALEKGGELEAGKMTPYTANFIFTLGVLASSFVFVTIFMRNPVDGNPPVAPTAYFKGTIRDHIWGLVGGGIWAVGMTLNVIASGVTSRAVSYGLGQGATMVAAIWGVCIWREFRLGSKSVGMLINLMFVFFFVGLGLIIWTKM